MPFENRGVLFRHFHHTKKMQIGTTGKNVSSLMTQDSLALPLVRHIVIAIEIDTEEDFGSFCSLTFIILFIWDKVFDALNCPL